MLTHPPSALRRLVCKVEEIHTTLRQHLAKEEAQLLPLLLQHFSHAEQAELVAQFLYCIPLATVEHVLRWIRPMVPQQEQEQLTRLLRDVIPDHLLLHLLTNWLQPLPPSEQQEQGAAAPAAAPSASAPAPAASEPSALAIAGSTLHPPIQGIIHFHHSIKAALEALVAEARALQKQPDLTASALASLVERHRFLRSVCSFHTQSEEEVMLPEAHKLAPEQAGAAAACSRCTAEHQREVALFEDLGHLLADVRAFARRGRKVGGPVCL